MTKAEAKIASDKAELQYLEAILNYEGALLMKENSKQIFISARKRYLKIEEDK